MSGQQIEKTNSFRRLFRRAANSIRMRTADWETCGNKNLFYGVASVTDYNSVPPWISPRELEEEMVEEAETAGDLFLKAGIVESSRFAWSLATQFYSETFNYARLAYVYRRLSLVISSQVPEVDPNNQLELSSELGRFYRVWFHGSAPDELVGEEFVYRAAVFVKLEEFGKHISNVLKSLLPEGTSIDLVLDDGRPEEVKKRPRRAVLVSRGGQQNLGVCQIKVTPLRPLMKSERNFRGSPDWFLKHSEMAVDHDTSFDGDNRTGVPVRFGGNGDLEGNRYMSSPRHIYGRRNSSSDSYGTSTMMSNVGGFSGRTGPTGPLGESLLGGGDDLIGVDTFSFTHPHRRDRRNGARDWFKTPGDFAEKSLKVTRLVVDQCFPACVSRQQVIHRSVFYRSPLEAGVEAVCSWCAVLFRTAVATNGLSVLGVSTDQGIGTAAAKVVADCIHCSRVKEMGQALLKSTGYATEEGDEETASSMMGGSHGKLQEEEVTKYQMQLARSIVTFMELLHLLIARNRDLLLAVVRKRRGKHYPHKRGGTSSIFSNSPSPERSGFPGSMTPTDGQSVNPGDESTSASTNNNGCERTDRAIAVQSELQRSFIGLTKNLQGVISKVISSETPRWLKLCTQDGYFSSGIYHQTRISLGEELFFLGESSSHQEEDRNRASPGMAPLPSVSVTDHSIGVGPVRSFSPSGSSVASTSRNSESKRNILMRSPTHSTSSVDKTAPP